MEIRYFAEDVFAYKKTARTNMIILEFEDGDRHIEIALSKEATKTLYKQLISALK